MLLLVAKDDRKLRIEVGRGLEGAIPDAFAKRIIDEEIAPRFRQGDFYGGIAAGVDRIIKLVEGEPMPPPPARARASRLGIDPQTVFIGFILVIVLAKVLHALLGRGVGSGVVAVGVAAIVYAVVGLLTVAVLVGIVAFVVSLFTGSGMGRYGRLVLAAAGARAAADSAAGAEDSAAGGGGSSGGGASGSW